jgi:hypothetical protein
VERPVANLSLRIPDELLARFDLWAADKGGRASALRRLIGEAASGVSAASTRLPARPVKLTVRLAEEDISALKAEAGAMSLTPNGWAAALIRYRLYQKPTFRREDEVALIAIQAEYRRIGVNTNQIARALNTAVLEGRALDLEIAFLEDLRTELRAHLSTLRAAFDGASAYWDTAW